MHSSLLWVVAYGHLAWWSIVAVLAVTGAALGPRLARSFGAGRARRRLAALGPASREIPAGESVAAVLTGVLACDEARASHAAVTVAIAPETEGAEATFVTESASGLALVVGEARVRVEGRVEVVHGSRAPRGAFDAARLAGDDAPRMRETRALHAGDRVRVSGVIEALHEADGRSGYRGAAPTWKLTPGVAGRVLMAFEGASEPTMRPVQVMASSALAFALAWAAVSSAASAVMVNHAVEARGRLELGEGRAVCAGGGRSEAALASMDPPLRARALEALGTSLACQSDRTRDTWDALDRVHRAARTSCLARAALFEDVTDYERAAREWSRCETAESWPHAARLWFALGRFREASDALSHTAVNPIEREGAAARDALYTHVLAGQFRRAAEVARGIAESAQRRPAVGSRERSATMLCLEASLLARDGDPSAAARLRGFATDAATGDNVSCQRLAAWASDRSARAVLASIEMTQRSRYGWIPFDLTRRGLSALATRYELEAPRSPLSPTPRGLSVALDQVDFDTNTGAWDAARRTLDAVSRALAAAPFDQSELYDDARRQAVAVAAHLAVARGGPDACGDHADEEPSDEARSMNAIVWDQYCLGYARLRRGAELPDWFWEARYFPANTALREAIARGDGAATVRALRQWRTQDGVMPRSALTLTALRNPTSRRALRSWLATEDRWASDDHMSVVNALSDRLSAAQSLGDSGRVAEVRAVLARHRAALLDEESAMQLAVIRR